MSDKLGSVEHTYYNEDKVVNYISINGIEYVIGEFDTFEEALDQFELVEKINKDGSFDWMSSRPGKNM